MRDMRRWISRAALTAALGLAAVGCGGGLQEEGNDGGGGGQASTQLPTVRLASNDFTEQLILADIYKQALEKAGYTVDYKARLGPREVVAPALESGEIDMYIEYAGSALQILAKQTDVKEPQQIFDALKAYYQPKGITPLEQTPMSDQNAFAITQEVKQQHNITTLSDMAKVADQLTVGGPPECEQRVTCLKGVQDTYQTRFKAFEPIAQGSLKYQALLRNDIQVALAFTTDGIIAKENLYVVEDDKGVFPPDHAVPVVRNDFLDKAGSGFTTLVNRVSSMITTEEITQLNAKVDLDREDPEDVAREWLTSKGLI